MVFSDNLKFELGKSCLPMYLKKSEKKYLFSYISQISVSVLKQMYSLDFASDFLHTHFCICTFEFFFTFSLFSLFFICWSITRKSYFCACIWLFSSQLLYQLLEFAASTVPVCVEKFIYKFLAVEFFLWVFSTFFPLFFHFRRLFIYWARRFARSLIPDMYCFYLR